MPGLILRRNVVIQRAFEHQVPPCGWLGKPSDDNTYITWLQFVAGANSRARHSRAILSRVGFSLMVEFGPKSLQSRQVIVEDEQCTGDALDARDLIEHSGHFAI